MPIGWILLIAVGSVDGIKELVQNLIGHLLVVKAPAVKKEIRIIGLAVANKEQRATLGLFGNGVGKKHNAL